jgi:formamidopyrimidine-DNA glycosylase
MPELPDLQAFSHTLSKKLLGKTVEKIHAIHTKKLNVPHHKLRDALVGATLTSVYREGKELYFVFDNGNTLGLHLMLKGQLNLFRQKNQEKFAILELVFTDGTGLALADFQKQATPTLNPQPKEAPDALSPDAGYKFLKEKLNRSRSTVKKVLTDQKVIRGIGNAYADEILWHARISPFSVCNKLPDDVISKLARSIRSVLLKAEKTILKTQPGIIGGELRGFLSIHNPDKTHSPTGARIRVDESGARKTYYTDEQQLFE